MLHDWVKISRPFFIQSEVEPKPIVTCFPALCVSYILHAIFQATLIGLLHCLCTLRLLRVIILVLVLQHLLKLKPL